MIDPSTPARNGKLKVMKGAVATLEEIAHTAPSDRAKLSAVVAAHGESGYRSIAVAVSELLPDFDEKGASTPFHSVVGGVAASKLPFTGFRVLGVIAMFDPPRDDSQSVIQTLNQMGVRVKMLTGVSLSLICY